jgi:hypothetical protein
MMTSKKKPGAVNGGYFLIRKALLGLEYLKAFPCFFSSNRMALSCLLKAASVVDV